MTIKLDMPDSVYHQTPGITFHRLMDFVSRGPAFFYARHISGEIPAREATDWGNLGSAYHIYGLEGEEAFRNRVVCTPATYMGKESAKKDAPEIEKPWNMSANFCKEWVAAHSGKIVLPPDDYSAAQSIGRNFRANQHAARLLACGWPELTVIQPEPRFPVPIMGRIDWLASTSAKSSDAWAIIDPKGTTDLDHFERDCFRYRYHRQLAFYRWLVEQEIGKRLPCFLAAVEKDGMHRCRVFQLEPELLDLGHEANCRDLDRLAEHYAGKPWSLDHDDSLRVLATPAFLREKPDADAGPSPLE